MHGGRSLAMPAQCSGGGGAATAALLIALALAAGALPAPASAQPDALFPESNKGLRPSRLVTFGLTHYYQMAENAIGTVAFFHGCARKASHFFPYDPVYCPECLGFPEHLSHTKQALARGYNVLALEPHDDKNFCWSSSDANGYVDDQPRAIATLRYFIMTNDLTSLPIYLWGSSSGGTLALKLMGRLYNNDQGALRMAREKGVPAPYTLWGSVQGIIAETSTPTDFDASDANGRLLYPGFPPTIFVRMERDGAEGDVRQNLAFFARNGVPSDVLVSPVRRIGATYFSDRTPTITPEQSTRIVEGLKEIGLVGEDGQLTANPKDEDNPRTNAFRWTTKLQALVPQLTPMSKSLSLVLKFSPIQQSLMVAYAKHDAVSDYFTACLAWLESKGRADAQALARQLAVPGGILSNLTPDRKYPPSNVGPNPREDAPRKREEEAPIGRAQQLDTPSSGANRRARPASL